MSVPAVCRDADMVKFISRFW